METATLITLKCFSCGITADIEVPGPPRFAFELASWADDVGWVGIIDYRKSRSLVFCSEKCLEKAKTKDGKKIRARPLYSSAQH